MQQTPSIAYEKLAAISTSTGFSGEAVTQMFEAMTRGNGTMAQFDHPEFGGHGQWMKGGMTMVAVMGDEQMKDRINALCAALSSAMSHSPAGSKGDSKGDQVQHQMQTDHEAAPHADAPTGTASKSVNWWPASLSSPYSTGAQNETRYAYFSAQHRLAIQTGGKVTVYDTLDHEIGGFSQQQSRTGSMSFSSNKGAIDVRQLPVVSVDGVAPGEHEKT